MVMSGVTSQNMNLIWWCDFLNLNLMMVVSCMWYSRSNILEACSTCFPHAGAPKMAHIFRMDENTHAASLPDVWTPLIRFFNLQLRGRPPRRVPALPRRPLPRRIDAAAADDTGGGVSTVCLRVFFGGSLPAPPCRGRRGCRGRGRSCMRRSREGTAGR